MLCADSLEVCVFTESALSEIAQADCERMRSLARQLWEMSEGGHSKGYVSEATMIGMPRDSILFLYVPSDASFSEKLPVDECDRVFRTLLYGSTREILLIVAQAGWGVWSRSEIVVPAGAETTLSVFGNIPTPTRVAFHVRTIPLPAENPSEE